MAATTPPIMMDEDLPFFEAKIDKMKIYLGALKAAAAEEVLSTRIEWFNSVIEHLTDMINVFILCKSKLEAKLEKKKLANPLAAATTSCSQRPPSVSRDHGVTISASNVVLSDSAVSTTSYKPIRSDGPLFSRNNNTSSSTNALSSGYGTATSSPPPASQVISKPLISRDNTSASSNVLSSDATTSYMPLRSDGSSLQHLSRSNTFSSSNVRSSDYGTSTSTTAPVNSQPLLASWAVENKESIVFMNIPESTAFEPKQKTDSDLGDVLKILECIGASATVQSVCRFSPKSLPADRPPFLKARFSSEEEKKQVFACVKANHSRIRALGDKFAECGFCDPDKSGKPTTNSYRNNDNPGGTSSYKSRSQGASPTLVSRSNTTTTIVSQFGSLRLPSDSPQQSQSSNGLAVSQAKARFGFFSPPSAPSDASSNCRSATNLCPPSSSIAYPSSFGGNRDRFSANPNTTPLGTNRVYQPLQPATSVEDVRRPQIGHHQTKAPSAPFSA